MVRIPREIRRNGCPVKLHDRPWKSGRVSIAAAAAGRISRHNNNHICNAWFVSTQWPHVCHGALCRALHRFVAVRHTTAIWTCCSGAPPRSTSCSRSFTRSARPGKVCGRVSRRSRTTPPHFQGAYVENKKERKKERKRHLYLGMDVGMCLGMEGSIDRQSSSIVDLRPLFVV